MGILNILKKTSIKIAERRVKKVAIETAKVMLKVAYINTQMFQSALEPHQFAIASIYRRRGWSIGDNFSLQLDGIDTDVRFCEGVDIADIIEFVEATELATDPNIEYAYDNEMLISLAGEVAN